MPIIDDPRVTGAIPGDVNAAGFAKSMAPEESPTVLDTLAAASRVAFLPGAAVERISNRDFGDTTEAPADFDPFEHIAGFEDYALDFADADSLPEVEGIKARIRSKLADKETLRRAGIGGPIAEITLNLLDPTFLLSAAVPELAIAKVQRVNKILTSAARGATGATAYEIGMHQLDDTRTLGESGINIGAGALISGLLGSLSRRAKPAELKNAREAVAEEIVNPNISEQAVGAAATRRGTTLELEGLAAGGDTLSRVAGKIPLAETDTQRVMRAESLEARRAIQELVDVPGVLNKNLRGEASPTSVETLIERHLGRVAEFAHELKTAWRAYKARPIGEVERRLTRKEFERAVAAASRRGDRAVEPEIERAAQYLRSRVFDPLKQAAQRLGLLPPDGEIQSFAESYFKRMYDRHKIRAERATWDALLTDHFAQKGLTRPEARAVAEDVTRQILGTDVGLANFNVRPRIPNAGPLEARVLDIRDEAIEPFLVSDPVKIASAYVREMAPQVEITKRFGDKDARDIFQRVADDYMTKRGLAGRDVKRLDALQTEEKAIQDTLSRLVLRLYGRAGALAPEASIGQRTAAHALRGWRNLVAAAKLGSTAITGGVQDLSKIVGMYGFAPTLKNLTKLATSSAFRKLSRDNARRMGVATEVALARRVAVASDGAMTEGWTERLSNLTYSASGLNHVTDMWRTLAATLIEDKILKSARLVKSGAQLPKAETADLASIGISLDDLRRIADQVETHGTEVDGIHTSGSMFWTDPRLAEVYDSAIVKEARVAVMQPGVGDRVWWADSEIGKTLGQLKAFALSAPLRMTMAPVQLVGQGRYLAAARLTGALMVGGYLSHVFRQLAAGKEPVTEPGAAAGEAFAESGLGGILPDILSPFARRFGLFGESARYSDRNVMGAFGGPGSGLLADAYDILFNRTADGLSAADLQALRRLLPLQNLWYLRRAINALEGETAEALGLEGATADTFLGRAARTDALASSTVRGGTGTGAVVQ